MSYVDAEGLPSSFKMNNVETVDTVFSKLLIANLFKNQTFIAGETFTDKYNERGGQIYVRRPGKQAVATATATSANGLNFTHTETADSLVLIQKTKAISRSEKCYDLVETLRASGKSVDKVAEVIEEFKEGCQEAYMDMMLADTSTGVSIGGATRSSSTTQDDTFAKLVTSILADRKQIVAKGGKPDVIIISPDMEALFLANAYTSGNAFVPETNEEIVKTGRIGRLFGMKVYVSNLIGTSYNSSTQASRYYCEYIIYDHETFAIAMDIEGLRMTNAIDFVGSYAQIQALVGGGVANKDLAIAKIYTP